jgi:hypothetical protein
MLSCSGITALASSLVCLHFLGRFVVVSGCAGAFLVNLWGSSLVGLWAGRWAVAWWAVAWQGGSLAKKTFKTCITKK